MVKNASEYLKDHMLNFLFGSNISSFIHSLLGGAILFTTDTDSAREKHFINFACPYKNTFIIEQPKNVRQISAEYILR